MGRRAADQPKDASLTALQGYGERIKEARSRAKLTQEGLAKLIGISRPTLTKFEKGEAFAPPTIADVERIAVATGTDPAWIAYADDREIMPTVGASKPMGRLVQRDDSNAPRFPVGTRFLFDPDATVHPGDLVAVRADDGLIAVRSLRNRLNAEDKPVIELRPLNPDFQAEVISPSDLVDRLQGRIVEYRITI